uniref:Ig-like domain-containing protein n=1 Tax=Cyprinodon variegatus TaxID=28743 RepID=A0A3Q2FH85_CYPVA
TPAEWQPTSLQLPAKSSPTSSLCSNPLLLLEVHFFFFLSDFTLSLNYRSVDLVEFSSSVHLSCSFAGFHKAIYWMNGSSEVTRSDRVQISTSDGVSTLTMANVSRYDHGSYWCKVINYISDDRSEPVNVFISYGPENTQLEISPSNEHHEEGVNIQLVRSAESRPSAQFHWFLNGAFLPNTGSELRLMDIQASQSGNYSCQAFNSKTLRYQTSEPSAVSVLGNKDCIEFNSTVTVFCSASGYSPNFHWMNSSSKVIADDRVEITEGGSTLTILNVTRYDLEQLRCHVFNYFSEVFSDPVNLSMYYGPEKVSLTISPTEKYFKEGSDIHLSSSADSRPAAEFQWFLNTNLLSHFGSELRLTDVKMSDSGSYSCQVFNSKTLRYQKSQPVAISVVGKSG